MVDNLPPSCAVVTKSGNLNFLESSGPVQACNGTALPLHMQSICSTVAILFIFVQLQRWWLKSFEFVLDELHIAVLRLCMAVVLRLLSQHLFSFPSLLPTPSFPLFILFLLGLGCSLTNCPSWVSVLFFYVLCFCMTGQASVPAWCCKGRLLSYCLIIAYLAQIHIYCRLCFWFC